MEKQMIIDKILEIYKTDASNGRYDLIPLFQDNNIFSAIINILSEPYLNKIDYIASPEALGWILGVGIARKLEVGFVPIRKENKLPYSEQKVIKNVYMDYSKLNKAMEIKNNIINKNSRILLVDEWVETGLTIKSCIKLMEKLDCKVIGIATIGIDENENTKEWIEKNMVTFVGKNI
jgi:adenine phosphoribosyltransferase